MLSKVNKAVIMVSQEHLLHVIQKTIIVQTYDDYPKYATHDNNMIARMLHLPPCQELQSTHNWMQY